MSLNPYNLNENVAIRACAGAGKTYTLAWRYMAILDDFAKKSINELEENWLGPSNILVITFTKKATAELNQRIIEILSNIINGENKDFPVQLNNFNYSYSIWLQKQLLNSKIMTLDSFCMSILKDNPILSGIDPNIKMMDEFEASQFYENCYSKFTLNLSDTDFKLLIKNFGANNIKELFIDSLNNQLEIPQLIKRYSRSENEILNNWINDYQPNLDLSQLINSIFDCANIIIHSNLTEDIKEKWKEIYSCTSTYNKVNPDDKLVYFKINIFPLLITKAGTPRASLGKTGNKAQWKKAGLDKVEFDDLASILKINLSKLDTDAVLSIFTDEDLKHAKLIKLMLKLINDWFKIVDQNKSKLRVVTFPDLLNKSLKILRINSDLKKKLSENYHHIMVDEFQDTTHSHWELIKSISEVDGILRKKGLFIVGDEKQSIYRFNQADVTTFSKAISDIKNVLPKFNPDCLDWNFRSTNELISNCINPLFKKIFINDDDKKLPYMATHQKTISHVSSPNKVMPSTINNPFTSFNLDLMLLDENEDDFKKDIIAYPLHIASQVKEILDINNGKYIDNNLVAILLNAVKPVINSYTEAFSRLGIKVEIVAGASFYQSQEIMDVEMLISLLLNPEDNLAMCGILKSPIFSFTDSEIHEMIIDRKNISIYQYLEINYHNIIMEINEWIINSKTIPIDRLLNNIFNNPKCNLGYLSEHNGEQRLANINKMISIIHNWSLAGDSLEKIRETLKGYISKEVSEENFPISKNTKAVIMSIHKSKGLAFPFVIIPEIQKSFNLSNKSRMFIDFLFDKSGNRVMEPAFIPRKENWESQKYALTHQMKIQLNKELFEEKKRLLYVGITRAKYGVILSGFLKKKDIEKESGLEFENSKSWLDWLRAIYPIDSMINKGEFNKNIEYGPQIKINSYKRIENNLDKKRIESIDILPIQNERYLPTFFQKSVTQLFNLKSNHTNTTQTDNQNTPEKGILIHKILEMGWLELNDIKKINEWIQKKGVDFQRKINDLDLKLLIKKLQQNKHILFIQSLPENECFPELWLQSIISSSDEKIIILLTGIIDVLYKRNNQWYVLDYKSGDSSKNNEAYTKQIQAYLQLVNHVFGIEAIGQILYLEDNKLITISNNKSLFSHLEQFDNNSFKFNPSIIGMRDIQTPLIKKSNKTTIILSNSKRKRDFWFYLLIDKKLNPNINIITYVDFKNQFITNNIKLPPPLVKRQIIINIFNNKLGEFNLKNRPGIVDMIYEAYESYFKTSCYIVNDLRKKYNLYIHKLKKYGFSIGEVISENLDFGLDKNTDYLFETPAVVTLEDKNIVNQLKNNEKIIEFPIFNEVPVEKNQEFLLNQFKKSKNKWMQFNTIRDEIHFIGKKIIDLNKKGALYNQISIILPSMEEYLPILVGLFRSQGIPLSIRKTEPISEKPIIISLLSYCTLFNSNMFNWIDIKSWFESSLFQIIYSDSSISSEVIYELDLLLRKKGLLKFKLSQLDEMKSSLKNFENIDSIELLIDFLSHVKSSSQKNSISIILNQLQNSNYKTELIESDKIALDAFIKLINEIQSQIDEHHFNLSNVEILNEINHFITKIEFSPNSTDFGVEIISIMDSQNIANRFIFIPGMSRDVFPVRKKQNPFITLNDNLHEDANFQIFISWFKSVKNIYLSYPKINDKNELLEPTIFMNGINPKIMNDSILFDSEINLINTIGKLINPKTESKSLLKVINRHNAFVNNNIPEEYFGKIQNYNFKNMNREFSATSFDELFFTPYLYLLKRNWKLYEIDNNVSSSLTKGDFIHRVFEIFGNQNGWEINRKAKVKGTALLDEVIKIEKKKIDKNLLPIIDELSLSNPTIWELILKEELSFYPTLLHYKSELEFGSDNSNSTPFLIINHPEIGEIKFKGKIDRIDKSKDEKNIIIQDFKTGEIIWGDLSKDMSRQLFIYYLVVKQLFPEARIAVSYRKVKNITTRNFGFYNSFIIDDDINSYEDINIKNNNNHIYIKNENDIKDEIISAMSPIISGLFNPFSKKYMHSRIDSYYYLKNVARLETIKFFLS
ncbi:MAG: UvrD-helicase domain-containing protein [Candidatus Marinimicrobia bacterium]|nr:UvrD-helicase domain-containing protein [Candidatus Neomarinimicrobiota bacterium]